MVNYKENRGSEWRKWDLHVHTPESGLANGFKSDWDGYVKTLFQTAIKNGVAVLGITDYFTIEGYEILKTQYLNNDAKLKELFNNDIEFIKKVHQILVIPNIEFRLKQTVNGNRINYHVIFSDEVAIEDINENFLFDIHLERERYPNGDSDKVKICHRNIEEFGRKLKSEQPEFSGSDFEVGCRTAIVDEVEVSKALNKAMFKDKYVIVIPPDEDLCGLDWTKQDHNVRKLFIQGCHAFFTSNKGTIAFALGEKHSSKKDYLKEFKSFKPCFIGCDAHSLDAISEKLGVFSDEKECKTTWIKADTTFQGLLQTLYEPELRVRIQAGKPDVKNARNVISSIVLTDNEGKFEGNKILLNEYLNSIIGGKSSGKSLLLHSLAITIDKPQVDRISEKLSIEGYQKLQYDMQVEWADGRIDSMSKPAAAEDGNRKVTYIPQLYINYLAERNNRNELNSLIVNILRQNSEFNTFFQESLDTISVLSQTINANVDQMIQMRKDAKSFFNQLNENGRTEEIQKSVQTIEAQIKELEKNLALSDEEKAVYEKFKTKEDVLTKQISLFGKYIQIEEEIEEIVGTTIINIAGTNDNHGNIEGGEIETTLSYYPDIPTEFQNHFLDFRKKIIALKDELPKSFDELKYKEALTKANKELELEKKAIALIQKKVNGQSELKKANEQLKKEKERLTKSVDLSNKVKASVENYRNMQKTVADLLKDRFETYEKVVDKINGSYNEMANGITLTASVMAKKEESNFYSYVNKNKLPNNHPFYQIYTDDGLVDIIKTAELFADIKNCSTNTMVLQSSTIEYPINQNVSINDILSSLSKDIMSFSFEVKYKDDSLFEMSPGKKGTVLLLLFLQLSSSEYPILIDQPEDNLDNRTIYDLLCKMIRDKKKDRQIILISHNANIVVATDSENIIVANQRGQTETGHNNQYRFEYVNGSIETSFDCSQDKSLSDLDSKGIRQHVCDILEGGDDAFLEREQKYSIRKYE